MAWHELLVHRWFAWLNLVGLTVLAAASSILVVSAVTIDEAWVAVALLPVPAFFGVGALSIWWRFLPRGVPHRVTEEQAAQSAVTVLWLHRSRFHVSLIMLALLSYFFLIGALAAFGADYAILGWILVALGALFLSTLPDMLRALVRRPRLVLSPSQLSYRGPAVDVDVEWDDVVLMDVIDLGHEEALLITPHRPGRTRSRRIIWKLEEKLSPGQICVAASDPRDAELSGPVRVWIETYLLQPERRSELGTPAARERLEALRKEIALPG